MHARGANRVFVALALVTSLLLTQGACSGGAPQSATERDRDVARPNAAPGTLPDAYKHPPK